jgi:hypothetical protein
MSNKCIICQVGELKRSNQKYCSRHCILFSKRGKNEKYLRYKDTIKKANKRNYKKYKFGKYVQKYKENNLEKVRAKDKSKVIPIPKDKLCENCQERFATQRHHEDYNKPMEIMFVCRNCHGELDRLRRLRENGR